ncbi:hypothetical protein D3C83_125790 [compost metagenome]
MQAGAVVIHFEVAQLEREMRRRVGAVDDGDDAARAGHAGEILHRENLPGQVGDVAEVQHLGARRDRA